MPENYISALQAELDATGILAIDDLIALVALQRVEINRLQAEAKVHRLSEIPCCQCNGPVVEFSIPNEQWNTLVRKGGPETDQEYLCLGCFIRIAAEEVKRLKILCTDLVGEETLHQYGLYKTEMQKLRAIVDAHQVIRKQKAEIEKLQERLIFCEQALSRLAFASPPPPQVATGYFRRYPKQYSSG